MRMTLIGWEGGMRVRVRARLHQGAGPLILGGLESSIMLFGLSWTSGWTSSLRPLLVICTSLEEPEAHPEALEDKAKSSFSQRKLLFPLDFSQGW